MKGEKHVYKYMVLLFFLKLGWQYRWFTVDAQTGTLSYYICDNTGEDSSPPNIVGSTPRWQVFNYYMHKMGSVLSSID